MGINETINTIRSAQKEYEETQEHTLTLVTFDSGGNRPDVRTLIDNMPINAVTEFKNYMPFRMHSALRCNGTVAGSASQSYSRQCRCYGCVTILTDGLENASREWTASKLRTLIEQLKEEGWSFSYMGSAHDVKEVTDLLSIDNVVEFSHDQLGADNTWMRESLSA